MSEDAEQPPAEAGGSLRGARRGKRRARPRAHHTVAKVVLSSLLVVAMVTSLGMVFVYRHLNDNLDVVDVSKQLKNRPNKRAGSEPKEPLNILVMGSDTRAGEGNNIDNLTGSGERSDTTIMFHLSGDREFAYGVSIPRDSLVDRPDCFAEDGEAIPGEENAMWNEAFSVGGPACTIQQFEQLSGVFIDHYVVLDFAGFQDMVDAIDGVEVCIPEDISDPAHGIDIPAGTREIRGKEALNYVRARYTLGDGSDIGRIKRQQAFIAAMASKVISGGTLARLDRVVSFLDAATESLQTDLESVLQIGKVGVGFRNIGLDKIKFITVPWEYSAENPGRVEWLPQAEQLWEQVRQDEPLTRRLLDDAITAGQGVDGSPSGPDDPGKSPDDTVNPNAPGQTAEQREAAGLCA